MSNIVKLTTPMIGEIWIVFEGTKQAREDFHGNYKQVRGNRVYLS